MNEMLSPGEALIYHFANRYLRHLLPAEYRAALQDRFICAEQKIKDDPEALAWSQRVLWLPHWDGVLSSPVALDAVAETLSTALLKNRQVTIRYQGKKELLQFNVFGLIKRDESLLALGSYGQSRDPLVLAARKILAIELTETPAIQPTPGFDVQDFLQRQLNFPHAPEKIACLQIEFAEELYSYVCDHVLVAERIHIIKPEDYHHNGYFLLEAYGIADGERLRQWIRGFGSLAQVLKPNNMRLIMEQARLDTRTNLLTAIEFQRCLKREIQRCLRDNQMTFALLILDLDHFKQVNDLNGHDFGDVVLLQVADCIREYDEAARHGGEEFCILLPDTRADEAHAIAERIRQRIEQQEIENQQGTVVPVSTSIGLAAYPDDLSAEIKSEILSSHHAAELSEKIGSAIFYQADQALYKAKAQGRNRVYRAVVSA
jgi:diguanylate cyclase (GGDEF)-like protein